MPTPETAERMPQGGKGGEGARPNAGSVWEGLEGRGVEVGSVSVQFQFSFSFSSVSDSISVSVQFAVLRKQFQDGYWWIFSGRGVGGGQFRFQFSSVSVGIVIMCNISINGSMRILSFVVLAVL